MSKKIQISILTIFVAAALVGSILTIGENMAYAGGKKKVNEAEQTIGQNTETLQISECNSGNNTEGSCNNVAISVNANDGNNVIAQQ